MADTRTVAGRAAGTRRQAAGGHDGGPEPRERAQPGREPIGPPGRAGVSARAAPAPRRTGRDGSWVLGLQRTAGNGAVAGLLAPVQRADPPVPPDFVEDVFNDLRGLGVKEAQLGSPEAIRALDEGEARRLVGMLREYIAMGRGGGPLTFTSSTNIVGSWNAKKDDLGVGGDAGYESILHYVRKLDRLTRASLGGPWPDAIKELKHSTIVFAGAKFHVHPRMLYFAAAAQFGANEAAGVDESEGHYLAPGAVFDEIISIGNSAESIHKLGAAAEVKHERAEKDRARAERARARARRRGRSLPPLPEPEPLQPPEGAADVYDNLVLRLLRVLTIGYRQQNPSDRAQVGHPEPGLVTWVNDRSTAIYGLPPVARDDAQGLAQCRDLLAVLGPKPQRKQAHGRGGADPHGTHHAMGMAMDIFYGTGSGENITSRVLKGEGAAEVVAFLVRTYGVGNKELEGLVGRPPAAMVKALKRDEAAARAFSELLVAHVGDALARLDEAVEGRKAPEHDERLRYYRDLRRRIRRALGVRHARVGKLWRLKAVRRSLAGSRSVVEAALADARPSAVSRHARPTEFLAASRGAAAAYDKLRDLMVSPELDAAAPPYLAGPMDELEVIRSELDAAVDTESLAKARQELPAGLRRALRLAATEGRLVMDQPPELVEGIESVPAANLQGWHHWQLDDWRSVLAPRDGEAGSPPAGYDKALLSDMSERSQDDMRRILQIMAQSPAGWRAVFGPESDPASIRPVLGQWREARAAKSTEEVDVDEMLTDVEDNLPPPAMEGVSGERRSLATDLYARGFYDVALAVAEGD